MQRSEDLCWMALPMVKGFGPRIIRQLLTRHIQPIDLFHASTHWLRKEVGLTKSQIQQIRAFDAWEQAQHQLDCVEKAKLNWVRWGDPEYPPLLRQCEDAPTYLFVKGHLPSATKHSLAIVGTRFNTAYGREILEQWIPFWVKEGIQIISGLAYGIDILAHRICIREGGSTFAVLGHGLHTIYPAAHKKTALEMLAHGGWITEYYWGSSFEKEQFVRRNRIIAGISEAVLVVETGVRGGSMITRQFADDYHREVFSIPGPVNAPFSSGCNQLIREHKALLIDHPQQLLEQMGWGGQKTTRQMKLALDVDPLEKKILDVLFEANAPMHLEELSMQSSIPLSRIQAVFLELECKELVNALPGSRYKLTTNAVEWMQWHHIPKA